MLQTGSYKKALTKEYLRYSGQSTIDLKRQTYVVRFNFIQAYKTRHPKWIINFICTIDMSVSKDIRQAVKKTKDIEWKEKETPSSR